MFHTRFYIDATHGYFSVRTMFFTFVNLCYYVILGFDTLDFATPGFLIPPQFFHICQPWAIMYSTLGFLFILP